jgi:hypothetical protein
MDGPVLAIGRSAGAPVTPAKGDRDLSREIGELASDLAANTSAQIDAHKRLRDDLEKIDARTSVLAATQAEMRLALLKASNPDVTNLRLNPSTVLAIIMFIVSLGGGYLTLRDAIGDLKKGQELQRIQLESLAKTVIAQGVKP